MAAEELEELLKAGDFRKLDVRPGDKYVLMCPGHVSVETAMRLKENWEKFIGWDASVAVFSDGVEVRVIRANGAEPK